jgi:hypothetical protein
MPSLHIPDKVVSYILARGEVYLLKIRGVLDKLLIGEDGTCFLDKG